MEKFRYSVDRTSEEYFTFRGRWADYIWGESGPEYALRMGETTDYFYFTITSLYKDLGENFEIDITKDCIIFDILNRFIEGFELLDVKEEGTPERKTLEFKRHNQGIKITFKNMINKGCFCTIEFANARRFGDTRFANIISIDDKSFFQNPIKVGDFRYEFKQRVHYMFDDLEKLYENQKETTL